MIRNNELTNLNVISLVVGAIEKNNTLGKTELKWILDLLVDYLEVKEMLRSYKEVHKKISEEVDENTSEEVRKNLNKEADSILAKIYHRTLIEQYPFG